MRFAIFKALQKVKADRREAQKRFEKAYREMERQLAFQEAVEERSRRTFTYGDMQDIVNAATRGVEVKLNFADGTLATIRGTDPLDEYTQAMRKNQEWF